MALSLNEYQTLAMGTCMDSCNNIPYMLFNLQGEVGELASKLAKAIRKGWIWFDNSPAYQLHNQAVSDMDAMGYENFDKLIEGIKGELGDIAWQLAGLCSVLNMPLEDVCQYNLDKLASRKERGVIEGDGDKR